MKRGNFIVLEGIDGTGKTTQADLLKKYLLSIGRVAITTEEPTSGAIGQFIRQFLKEQTFVKSKNHEINTELLYLFAADRYEHLYNTTNGIVKTLNEGVDVICSRYIFSSYAYNGNTYLAKKLNTPFPEPDIVFFLNLSVEEALMRIGQRGVTEEYFEKSTVLSAVQQSYLDVFRTYDNRAYYVDTSLPIETVHSVIIASLSSLSPRPLKVDPRYQHRFHHSCFPHSLVCS